MAFEHKVHLRVCFEHLMLALGQELAPVGDLSLVQLANSCAPLMTE